VRDENRAEGDELAAQLSIAAPVARLLIQRGLGDPEAADAFLRSGHQDMHDPFLMIDMERVVARISRALESGEKIGIYGDYDVDGVTSAALLARVLRCLVKDPDQILVRVPHRRRDGYGLTPDTVDQFHAQQVTLLISTDCGISCHDAALRARAVGVDFIITDHHEPGETLPEAYAIINPKRAGSQYPFRELAGVGVAFKVGEAVASARGIPAEKYRPRFVDLVALGTVADNAALVGENRAMARLGLNAMAQTKKAGLRALLGAGGAAHRPVTASSISFQIAPRLNAVGRVGDAGMALDLLLTSDASHAHQLVSQLESLNDERRAEQERIWTEAKQFILANGLSGDKVLVVHGKNWHQGVVGIVAGRLADQFHRPALVIATDDEAGRGSARSAGNFPVLDALRDCDGLLRDYGGHSQAAGFDLLVEDIPHLRSRLNQFAEGRLTEDDMAPRLDIDMEMTPSEVCARTLSDLARMEPFGAGNREPVWVVRNLELTNLRAFGKQSDKSHLSLTMRADDMAPAECVWWRMAKQKAELALKKEFDVVFRLEQNHYGNCALRLNVQDLAPSETMGDSDFADPAVDPDWGD
jgi:single-stranded-DNA-specific exonuclease